MTGNWFAIFALLFWPVVAGALYQLKPAPLATVWTVLGAYLLLPTDFAIKFEMIPAFDKNSIPGICALIGCMLSKVHDARPVNRSRSADVLIVVYVISPVVSSILNNDPIVLRDLVLPGVNIYDGISATLSQFLFFLPFLLARKFLREPSDFITVLRALVVAGLFYSLPALFEIRMSPQLSGWIYGTFSFSIAQEFRYGAFRPVVFLQNGLVLAFFVLTSLLASFAILRERLKKNAGVIQSASVSVYLGLVLVLCRAAGAMVYGITAGALVLFSGPRSQLRVAAALVSIAMLYPLLRVEGVFPTKELVAIASTIDADRAQSLAFRFDQEDLLLGHALERPAFGWGRFGRSRVYDWEYSKDISTTDGLWIITIGQFGIVGFLAQFALMSLPVFRAMSAMRSLINPRDRLLLATHALIVALVVVEQLPNASISPWTWLLMGTLLGRTEALNAGANAGAPGRQSAVYFHPYKKPVG